MIHQWFLERHHPLESLGKCQVSTTADFLKWHHLWCTTCFGVASNKDWESIESSFFYHADKNYIAFKNR